MEHQDKVRKPHQEVPRGLARISNIIAIGSGKGGVGKSTVSTNFAIALAKTGAKVGLMDADIYGPSQPEMLGINQQPEVRGDFLMPLEKHGIKFMSIGLLLDPAQPVIWRGPMASRMIQQFLGNVMWGDLDYLIIDLPPGSGDVQITLAQQASLTGAIIVTTPQQVALGVAQKGLEMFRHVNVPILGIVENMSGFICPKCGENTPIFKQGGGKEMAARLGIEFLGGIPLDPDLMSSGDDGKPLMTKSVESPARTAFLEIGKKFKAIMEKGVFRAIEPKDIKKTGDGGIEIIWPDGESEVYKAYDMRINCPCAVCVSEETGERVLDPKSIPLNISIGAFQRVGNYAVSVSFSDGHETGIYKFDKLRDIQKKQKKAADSTFEV